MERPEFFYFDLGNVLASFDHQRAVTHLTELCGCPSLHAHEVLYASGLERRYEMGEISSSDFCVKLRETLPTTAADAQLLDACGAIFTLNREIIPVVAQLFQAGHRLGILSNTCESHWQWLTRDRYRILPSYFSTTVLSYEVGAMKPHPAIYERAIAVAAVPAHRVFFVDDLEENVQGARRAGIDAVRYCGIDALVRQLLDRHVPGNF